MKKTDGECLFSDCLYFFTSFSWILFLKKLCYSLARCWGNKIHEKSASPEVVARLCVHNITVIWIFFFLENMENLLLFKKWLWCIRAADVLSKWGAAEAITVEGRGLPTQTEGRVPPRTLSRGARGAWAIGLAGDCGTALSLCHKIKTTCVWLINEFMSKCIQIVLMCWGWPKQCVCNHVVCKMGDSGAAGRGGGPAGGAQRPRFLCRRSGFCGGAGGLQPPSLLSDVCVICLVLMKGSLLIAAFINISRSTKGRKTCTQTTGGEGSKSGGEETSKQGLWKPVQHDDTYFDLILFILEGYEAISKAR